MAGKGDKRRPALISKEEEALRWEYALGKSGMTEDEFKKKEKEIRDRAAGRSA